MFLSHNEKSERRQSNTLGIIRNTYPFQHIDHFFYSFGSHIPKIVVGALDARSRKEQLSRPSLL